MRKSLIPFITCLPCDCKSADQGLDAAARERVSRRAIHASRILPPPQVYDGCVAQIKLNWQSKLVLLLVLPFAGADLVIQAHWWAVNFLAGGGLDAGPEPDLRPGGAQAARRHARSGLCRSGDHRLPDLFHSGLTPIGPPYSPWHTASAAAAGGLWAHFLSTRLGRAAQRVLGTAERRQGRTAAQVAANLGVAAIACSGFAQSWLIDSGWIRAAADAPAILLALAWRRWPRPPRIRSPRRSARCWADGRA